MKLSSFVHQGRRTWGALDGQGLIAELGGGRAPGAPDLKAFLALADAERAAALAVALAAARFDIPAASVAFLPVIPDPGQVFCVGSNYEAHRTEAARPRSPHPGVFIRLPSSLTGHEVPIPLSRVSSALDYEAELAVIVGKPGRYIREEEAFGHVAGYCCFNDVSFRDWQQHTHQISPGKNFPGTGALGPFMVTPDEIPDLGALRLQARLNGQVMQSATISQMIFSVPQIIAYVSGFARLSAGDVIATGTPGGVGFLRDPPIFMKTGDVVEIEIDRLGVLRNPVVGEP
jgi:2-keto-4-pentenoate hydratase/2-oxohepta-3-ene-1,7-dioic acid hydratase in catechol pathway